MNGVLWFPGQRTSTKWASDMRKERGYVTCKQPNLFPDIRARCPIDHQAWEETPRWLSFCDASWIHPNNAILAKILLYLHD